jgi:hypothetical protein
MVFDKWCNELVKVNKTTKTTEYVKYFTNNYLQQVEMHYLHDGIQQNIV